MKSLLNRTLTQFVGCTAILLLLATPAFYLLTRNYYTEDIRDLVEAVESGQPLPATDLEQDLMEGMMLQFSLIMAVLLVSLTIMLRFLSKRMWAPFDDTLRRIERFSLESGKVSALTATHITEFVRLNASITRLMENNLRSYRAQKEFTENASHELQTPLAVFRTKLDLLLQLPDLTEPQAKIIQQLYNTSSRLVRLNRDLLLLARIDNHQYGKRSQVDVNDTLNSVLTQLAEVTGYSQLLLQASDSVHVSANQTLLEVLISNLIVNAVRHTPANGEISIALTPSHLTIWNTSTGDALDASRIFDRFYRTSDHISGNGLGLAIVAAVCRYHDWGIHYDFREGRHYFTVRF